MPPPRRTLHIVATALAALAVSPISPAVGSTLGVTADDIESNAGRLAAERTRAENVHDPTAQAGEAAARTLATRNTVLADEWRRLARQAYLTPPTTPATAAATAMSAAAGGFTSTSMLSPRPSDAFASDAGATVQSLTPTPTIPTLAAGASVDARAIDAYLLSKGSPLAGQGAAFVAHAASVGLDPRVLVAISGAETSFATYRPSQTIHNPFGLGPHLTYPSWEHAIAAASRTLGGSNYLGAGRVTIAQISGTWAPIGAANDPGGLNSNWVRNVGRYYAEQGADPSAPIFSAGVSAPAAGITTTGIGAQVAAEALTHLGTPYLWGGESPETGFDCSGLVQYLYSRRGIALPRVADAQARVGMSVPSASLQAGDAVFFADSSGYIGHEGLYLGNGNFIHAPRTGDVIKISSLLDPSYSGRYAGARRYA